MEFRIADTFTDSLNRLTGQEQKAVKTTAFDLQLNPAHPGMQFHRIERAKDPNFWSVRINRDIRLIVHKTAASLLLCYVDHHDRAYDWATRRKIERHPRTGAAQLVEVRERVEEIPVYRHVEIEVPRQQPRLFADLQDDDLLRYGIPAEWLKDVRHATEETLFDVTDHLPQEAAEALLELATGGTPQIAAPLAEDEDPFAHPDAQRRFRVLTNVEELERALDYPWEKWTVFLHPAQQHLVERTYSGPARVAGSAGTGKTIVGLHRAVYLARQHPDARILLATFSPALANALNIKLLRLIGNEPAVRDRIQVSAMTELAQDHYGERFGAAPSVVTEDQILALLRRAMANTESGRFSEQFLMTEWREVVDGWQLDAWEGYQTVPRLGRKARLGSKQRETLWAIFEQMRGELSRQDLMTWPMIFARLTDQIAASENQPFDFAVIDEAQDLSVAQLRFLAVLGNQRPDALFFTGDLGQRIFQAPFSWKTLGVDVRGRSHTLRINYRTSHQIRRRADLLLPSVVTDVDGIEEDRSDTISIFNGSQPSIQVCADEGAEAEMVAEWIGERLADGILPEEIGIFVRAPEQLDRALTAVRLAGATAVELDEQVSAREGCIAVSTMHLAKGLEFRAVVAMACDDEVIPLQSRIETVSDESELEEVYNTERHLLYVACTRARDHLLVTGVDPASEFLDDML